jgi:hypothetical protein
MSHYQVLSSLLIRACKITQGKSTYLHLGAVGGIIFQGALKNVDPKKNKVIKEDLRESVEQNCLYGTSLRNAEKKVMIVEEAIAFAEKSHLLIWPVHPCLHLITNIL